jgi:ABC-type Fe3+ transport system permease subunit/DNA-binding beta-propeller fold protein YncE
LNWVLFKNSLLVSGLSTVLASGLGVAAALWLGGIGPRPRRAWLAVAICALALPPFLVTNAWLDFLGTTGVWHRWLPFNIMSLGGTVWILSLLLWPIATLAVVGAWSRLEPPQLESDMAVTGWALVRGLLLPLAAGPLAQAAVLIFVLALNNFAVPAILQVTVLPVQMWIRFNTAFDTAGALRLSVPLLACPLLLLWWFARHEPSWPHLQSTVSPRLFRGQLGPIWFWTSAVSGVCLCLISVALPLLQILTLRRTWTELPGALAASQDAIWHSVSFSIAAATIVILVSLKGASFVRRSSAGASSHWLLARAAGPLGPALLWLPFLVPGVLLGLALIAVFNRPSFVLFYQSIGIVLLALLIRYLGLGWLAVSRAAQSVDPDLTDIARLNGATRWQMLRYVQWPQIAPRVGAAWYIIYLLCLWDVESIILVMPPDGETLAVLVFNLLHYGHNAQVNALCLTFLALAIAPLALWQAASLLRGWRAAYPRALGCLAASAACLLLLSGCGPAMPANEAAVPSRLFSRVHVIGSRGAGVGQLNKPRSVAVDGQDNLYVVDMTGRVQKFSSNDVFLLSWQMPQTDLGKPKGLCRDRFGNIVVIEPHYQRLNHFTTAGKLVLQWGERGTNAGQLSMPRAAAMNSRNEIFVSEYGAVERVQEFAFGPLTGPLSRPRFVASFGRPGNRPGEFNRPEGLCLDSSDRLYVADSCNHRIQIFSPQGVFLRAYGKAGKGPGELSYPYDICVDRAGRQYVCEFGNSRIQVFDAQDRPLEIIGSPGATPGRFSNPWGVALDSAGNLYVADSQNHRVQKFMRREGEGDGRGGSKASNIAGVARLANNARELGAE